MTIQQLAISETNGTLFSLDWQAANWLVPGNTHAYQDKAVIDAIADIASAAGAFIIPSREALSLTIKPKYRVAMLMNDPNTKNFQQDIADYAAKYGIDLKKLQDHIS